MLSFKSHSITPCLQADSIFTVKFEGVQLSAPSVKSSPSPKYTKMISLSTLAESMHTIIDSLTTSQIHQGFRFLPLRRLFVRVIVMKIKHKN